MITSIQNEEPNLELIRELLGLCDAENHWANERPLFRKLQREYHRHLCLSDEYSLLRCSNAGRGTRSDGPASHREMPHLGPGLTSADDLRLAAKSGILLKIPLPGCRISGIGRMTVGMAVAITR